MARDNRRYWQERALLREREAFLQGGRLSARLFEEYQRAAQAVRDEVGAFYARYAGEQGLTYEQAVAALNRAEAQEWTATLGDYVNRINAADPQRAAQLRAELDALSYNASITRLEALAAHIDQTLGALHDKGVAQLRGEFGAMFEASYYKKSFDLQRRVGYLGETARLSTGMVEAVVSYPWSGATFSDRLWRNKQALSFAIREALTQGLIRGDGLPTLSQALADRMGQSYRAAERLVQTETSHLHNEADLTAYRAAGVGRYEILAVKDERTCEICGAQDGKAYSVADARAGASLPPFHPRCRCTTVEHDPEEALDWLNSGLTMPAHMTFAQWKKWQEGG